MSTALPMSASRNKPGDFCFDVRAHIGYHTLLIFVLAFEPFPRGFRFLQENAALNPAPKAQGPEDRSW